MVLFLFWLAELVEMNGDGMAENAGNTNLEQDRQIQELEVLSMLAGQSSSTMIRRPKVMYNGNRET